MVMVFWATRTGRLSQACIKSIRGYQKSSSNCSGCLRLSPAMPWHCAFVEPGRAAAVRDDTSVLDTAQTLRCHSVLHLVQALAQAGWRDAPRLWLITSGVQAIGPDVEPISLAQSPLWGFARVIVHEQPELHCTRVDLSATSTPEEVQQLFEELCEGREKIRSRCVGTRATSPGWCRMYQKRRWCCRMQQTSCVSLPVIVHSASR